MWKDLVDKKGIKYAVGSKKPFTGRVFDNYKNKGRKLTGSFKNGKMSGSWTFWREDGKIDHWVQKPVWNRRRTRQCIVDNNVGGGRQLRLT